GMSQAHIRRLLATGTIKGVKVGRDWLVIQASLENYMANRPRPGRKPKGRPGSKRREQ
ncbi:MAG: helix-turn-helix domain-containing protein, partial [Chloroflexi bacterium]|nr:helix-turn-helix domain-containing protein [Chloroflexota bacterium]